MGITKKLREERACYRKEIEEDLKKLLDMEDFVEVLHDIVLDPDRAYDHFYKWRDDAVNLKLRLKERVKFLLSKKLLSRDFGKIVLAELEEV